MLTKDTLLEIVKFGSQAPDVFDGGQDCEPLVSLPAGQQLRSLSEFLPPKFISQQVTLLESGSFCEYVNRFKTADTLIFANVSETGVTFYAQLDYHAAAPALKPARCAHAAIFEAIETPEWKIWKGQNRSHMDQVKFATFLEDNASLFVQPSGADLLDLVRSLHGHRNARFNMALRLDNGAYSVSYDEDVTVKGGNPTTKNGEMELPATIKAGMAVFQGAAPYEVPARLKTRCEDRRLVLWYETINPHQIVRESIILLVKQVADQTKIMPLLGTTAI